MNCVPDSIYMEWETSVLATLLFEPIDAGLDLDLVLALAPEVGRALPTCAVTKKGDDHPGPTPFDQIHNSQVDSHQPQNLAPPIQNQELQHKLIPHQPSLSLAYLNSFQAHLAFVPQKASAVNELPPPPGSIFAYCSERALHLDAPEPRGALGPTRTSSARRTHALVIQTVQREFAVEDRYRRRIGRAGHARERVRRRRDLTDYQWKPESVYKTFVDCKPYFFDKTSYQDHVPTSLCFGKINMRIPKAWTRGPNKPKRPKIMLMGEGAAEYGAPLLSDPSSDTLLSSTASVLEPSALLEQDFLQKFLPKFPAFHDEFALEMLLL